MDPSKVVNPPPRGKMDTIRQLRVNFFLLFITNCLVIFLVCTSTTRIYVDIPAPKVHVDVCPLWTAEKTITPLNNTDHFLVSAFMDQRVKGFDIRIIGIFKINSIKPLHCLFCCDGRLSRTTPAKIFPHAENFGFPFVTTDVMCPIPKNCSTTHITLQTQPGRGKVSNQPWLPVKNQKTNDSKIHLNFTVCISNLFGDYNNVLQFAQTLEMYRLLGVDRVVIYNTSCGPDLNSLLKSYSGTGFVEVVPWPIDLLMNPSRGWLQKRDGGDIHYYGQLTTLNECIYRYMERSRYVLLNDIDEIVMPYQHDDLVSMMDSLQKQQPNTGVFLIENHIFPKNHFEPSGRFHLPNWDRLPGVNILEHIYKEDPDRKGYHPHKMIVQPRYVDHTSVHEVLKSYGPKYKVPPDFCRIIHVRVALRGKLKLEELKEDKRLWDFQEKLVPNVDRALRRAGFL